MRRRRGRWWKRRSGKRGRKKEKGGVERSRKKEGGMPSKDIVANLFDRKLPRTAVASKPRSMAYRRSDTM